MEARAVRLEIKINYPVILFTVLLIHALILAIQKLPSYKHLLAAHTDSRPTTPLKIKSLRKVGAKESSLKDNVYLSKNESLSKKIVKERLSKAISKNHPLSLADLSASAAAAQSAAPSIARPGTRPETGRGKAISGITLQGNQIQQFAKGNKTLIAGDSIGQSLSNSDIAVNLEVPEGVSPDELNKYELMFYGFQRRTAINYINSFYKNLDRFQRQNPHLNFPLTDSKQVMTGRLTYDEKGNIKQIKMIRWSKVDRLQDFFLDVLKDMDTLHNPPQALWEKTGEFSIFFSLVVNG